MKQSLLSAPKVLFSASSKNQYVIPACIKKALRKGVSGIDSACFSTREKFVAHATRHVISEDPGRRRETIYIQSKFIPPNAQASLRTIPYDIALRLDQQLNRAFFDTYNKYNLGPLDSYLFFVPYRFPHHTLLLVWNTLIKIQKAGRVRNIGLATDRSFDSETALDTLERESGKRVQILQQKYPSNELAIYCRRNGIQLQRTLVEQFLWAEHQHARAVLREWAEAHNYTNKQAILFLSQISGAIPVVTSTDIDDIVQFGQVATAVLTKKQKKELEGIVSMLGL
ncbi:hypothetical protein QCA50_004061 [Cerrena zonata]|uniref:Uncharacterized protein n=1 Tax=Cerrena zonata TaxID=2478898 RepID=A0AAW0GGA2_9APHY